MSVCLSVCLCVCLSVRPFNSLFAPISQSPMSKLIRFLESLGKSNGKTWSQIWTLLLIKSVKSLHKKKNTFFMGWNWFFGVCSDPDLPFTHLPVLYPSTHPPALTLLFTHQLYSTFYPTPSYLSFSTFSLLCLFHTSLSFTLYSLHSILPFTHLALLYLLSTYPF